MPHRKTVSTRNRLVSLDFGGRFAVSLPWERLAADYNVLEGGMVPLGLLVLLLSPLIAGEDERCSLMKPLPRFDHRHNAMPSPTNLETSGIRSSPKLQHGVVLTESMPISFRN